MGVHLRVAPRLGPLADALAVELARPLADPFTTEVLAVPGDGVRAWLMDHLSRRLGVEGGPAAGTVPAGVAANIEVVFPATLVGRALGADPEFAEVISRWSVGQLTWVIYEILQTEGPELGIEGDLQRARTLADLFDRYGLHRVEMVRAWESGRETDPLGRALPDDLRWQPRLWRALTARLGPLSGPAAMAEATNRLRLGRITPDLPERVMLFGLASLPLPHLRVLMALGIHAQVELFVPTWSLPAWRAVQAAAGTSRLVWPIERVHDPVASAIAHPLASQWGRTPREAHLLLSSVVAAEPATTISEISDDPDPADTAAGPTSLLQRLQDDLRRESAPPGISADGDRTRAVHDPTDPSVSWHRCHGPGRQAEVLRDLVRGLLEERDDLGQPRFWPRDIAVLCADPHLSAPFIAAAFSADVGGDVPPIPLRFADRSLRQESSLFTAVESLLDLLGGRFTVGDLLGFAALDPVARRCGWDTSQLGRLATWVSETGVRWGLDEHHQVAFGLPGSLGVHTWRAGLDQLLLGAVMGDAGLVAREIPTTPADSPLADLAHPGIEGDLVSLVGSVGELIHHLEKVDRAMAGVDHPEQWCAVLVDAVRSLCALSPDDAWQWRRFDQQINEFLAESGAASGQVPVSAAEMTELFRARLHGASGRVRFGTGAVTVSSLTAQRGVPHKVVVIHGLDGDPGGGSARAEDLIAAQPCIGDRDPRSEQRAQLLDALLAAEQRLILIDTGRDITSNAEVPPAVPLAELADLIDATVVGPDPSDPPVSQLLMLEHPRHGWGERNFLPGAMIPGQPWGFEHSDLHAARARARRDAHGVSVVRWGDVPLLIPRTDDSPDGTPVIQLDDLARTLANPLRTYFAGRLGASLPGDLKELGDLEDLIPLSASGLEAWGLRDGLLEERLQHGSQWGQGDQQRWDRRQVRRGLVPPLTFGADALQQSAAMVDRLLAAAFSSRAQDLDLPRARRDVSVLVDLGGLRAGPASPAQVRIEGSIGDIRGLRLTEIRAGKIKAEHLLSAWLRLMVLACAEPEERWELRLVGIDPKRAAATQVAAVDMVAGDLDSCRQSLAVAVQLHLIALQSAVVAPAATTMALATEGLSAARTAWGSGESFSSGGGGDRQDRWVRFAFGRLDFEELMAIDSTEYENDPTWPPGDSRLECWAERIWGAVAATVDLADDESEASEESGDTRAPDSWLKKFVQKIWSAVTGTPATATSDGDENDG